MIMVAVHTARTLTSLNRPAESLPKFREHISDARYYADGDECEGNYEYYTPCVKFLLL